MYIVCCMWSSRGLLDKGVGLVMKSRVWIPKRSVVVLGRASNLKLLLRYIETLQCCQHCKVPFRHPNRKKKLYRFLTWENPEVKKLVSLYHMLYIVIICILSWPFFYMKTNIVIIWFKQGPYSCQLCNKVFPKWSQLQRHMKAHNDDQPYKCSQCDAAYNVEQNLILHESIHKTPRECLSISYYSLWCI